MGDHGDLAQKSGLLPNGLLPKGAANVTRRLDGERWAKAEERTAELIALIQPNWLSEERRNAVANYVQRLIMKCFSCQVFTFGSVPLKTYLPDGDIDLTAFSKDEDLKDSWAPKVRDMLEKEEKSENAEFHVQEVQYIQAEVKIVKCLVENIVVDISFNQVGGLCTLCFLEEIDHLINQNHLFKRSIILIKAWCYYESRILGAHHGLISTYALETLVLYIFHVFNNSFEGPLEVLYRFLEFFSNFDWENFCVSLWGPVPISSLPDTTAQPPRKDGGEMLLSQLFLNACSTVYAVMPPGQENQSQTFFSKFFNVVDPLRTNNNLGRSVNKGNFFRIRSAFAFGAKKLASLLECPKKNLTDELDKFFLNTWERHGSGNRPDASSLNIQLIQPVKPTPIEQSNNYKSTGDKKQSDKIRLATSHEHQVEGNTSFQDSAVRTTSTSCQNSQNIHRESNQIAFSHSQSQKNHRIKISSNASDQFERNTSYSCSIPLDKSQKYSKSDYYFNSMEIHGRPQFARTHSGPELTHASTSGSFQGNHNRLEKADKELAIKKVDHINRRKNFNSEVSRNDSLLSCLDDPASKKKSSSHQFIEAAADSNSVTNTYHDNIGFSNRGEECDSSSEKLEMHQEAHWEGQDLSNMATSSEVNNLSGQFQFPMHFPFSPILASTGYSYRNMPAVAPINIPLNDPSWGSDMQFSQGHVTLPFSHYFPADGQFANTDVVTEMGNESSSMMNLEDSDDAFWHEHDAKSSRDFENGGSYMHHDDQNQQSTLGGHSFIPSLQDINSVSPLRGQKTFPVEKRAHPREFADGTQFKISRASEKYLTELRANARSSTVTQSGSLRNRSASDSSRDGPDVKISKSARDKWGRKPSADMTSLKEKPKSEQQFERSAYHVSTEKNDHHRDWFPPSIVDNDLTDQITGSASSVTPHARSHQLPRYESIQLSGSDRMIPIAPVLIGGSHQGTANNPAVVPLTFFPTGPPVPFLTMLPLYNFQPNTSTSDGQSSQFSRDEEEDHDHHIDPFYQNSDSAESVGRPDTDMTATASNTSAVEPSDGHESDILNSDFASHWQNLQYGRSCENNPFTGQLINPPTVMIPPIYLQGHFPFEVPGRPLPTNGNSFTQLRSYGPHSAPLQPAPIRPSATINWFSDGPPRFRGGTGTYLPNPKVSSRDRQSPSARNHKASFNRDWGDLGDREESWINSKQRVASRSHGHRQVERLNSQLGQLSATGNQAVEPDIFRHETIASCRLDDPTSQSRNTSQSSSNMPYSTYPLPVASLNGVGPTTSAVHSVVMLYPYDQGAGYHSPPEPLEFGSLGPVNVSSSNGIPQHNSANSVREIHEQRHSIYGGAPCLPLDDPSLIRRSTSEGKYDLKDEDFPPLTFRNQGSGVGGGNNHKQKSSH